MSASCVFFAPLYLPFIDAALPPNDNLSSLACIQDGNAGQIEDNAPMKVCRGAERGWLRRRCVTWQYQ